MFSKEDVKSAVYEGLKEVLGTSEVTIRENETFTDYEIDSLDQMNLLLEIEKRLNIELGDLDLEKINTIELIHEYINDKKG
jgi:acyl carrier protein